MLNAAIFLTDDAELRWNEGISTMIQARLRHLLGLETFLNETPLLQSRSSSQGCYSHRRGSISQAATVSSIHEWFNSRQEKISFFFFAKVCSQVSAFSQNSKPAFTTPTSYQDLTSRRRSCGSEGGGRESKPQKKTSAQSRTAAWSFSRFMEPCRAWALSWPGYNWSSGGQRCTGTGLEGLQEQKSTWEASTLLQTRGVVICVFSNRFVLEAGGTDVDWNDIFKTQNDIWSFPFGDLHLLRTLKVMISHLVFTSLQNSLGKREIRHFCDFFVLFFSI